MKACGQRPELRRGPFPKDQTQIQRTREDRKEPGIAGSRRDTSCERKPHRRQKRRPGAASAIQLLRRSAQLAQRRASKSLQDNRNQGSREIVRQSLECPRIFFKKTA